MFTGIIEKVGEIKSVKVERGNLDIWVSADFVSELSIDQSISHNGVCLTVTDIEEDSYKVTAIEETLNLSNLKFCKSGQPINLERCLKIGDRLDGHMVQGHVDTTAECVSKINAEGSWIFTFAYPTKYAHQIISKGSICINGVSLTVVDPTDDQFSVAIIPYTYEHTTFMSLGIGDFVNIEFDILGKYINRYLQLRT